MYNLPLTVSCCAVLTTTSKIGSLSDNLFVDLCAELGETRPKQPPGPERWRPVRGARADISSRRQGTRGGAEQATFPAALVTGPLCASSVTIRPLVHGEIYRRWAGLASGATAAKQKLSIVQLGVTSET